MSVNSGFSTRLQQKKYNEYLETILSVFAKRIIKFYTSSACDQPRFIHVINHLYDKMSKMQENKFMQPHYSYVIKQVIMILNDNFQMERVKMSKVKKQYSEEEESEINDKLFKYHNNQRGYDIQDGKYRLDSKRKMSIYDNQNSKKSEKTLNLTSNHFRKRINTVTPETFLNPRYFTPQKVPQNGKQMSNLIKKPQNDSLFKNQKIANIKTTKQRHNTVHANNKIRKLDRQRDNLSPTQFLKQVVNGNGNKTDKIVSSHLVLRTRQKHQKMIET